MSDKYILDNDNNPVPCDDTIEWGKFFENNDRRRVAATELGPDITISTVFLGLDHRFGEGNPVLFETMVFGGEYDQYTERYCTWGEAERGHEQAVAMVEKSND
jgi:hypothetical protein